MAEPSTTQEQRPTPVAPSRSFDRLLNSLHGQLNLLSETVSQLEVQHRREVASASQETQLDREVTFEGQDPYTASVGGYGPDPPPQTRGLTGTTNQYWAGGNAQIRQRGSSRLGTQPQAAACCGGLVALMAKAVAAVDAEDASTPRVVPLSQGDGSRSRSSSQRHSSRRYASSIDGVIDASCVQVQEENRNGVENGNLPTSTKDICQDRRGTDDIRKTSISTNSPNLGAKREGCRYGDLWPLWSSEESESPSNGRKQVSCKDIVIGRVLIAEIARSIFLARFAEMEAAAQAGEEEKACKGLVISPGSWCNFVWEGIGGLHIAWDLLMIPMTAFDLPRELIFIMVDWSTCLYWSADVPYQFFVSYENNGVVEKDPKLVALHYLKTWFLPDVAVVVMDWIILVTGFYTGASRSWRTGKFVKAFRILRAVRLIRVLKFMRMLQQAMDKATTIRMVVYLKAAYMILFLFMASHYMGCYWYLMTTFDAPTNWVQFHLLEGSPVRVLYLHAIYWSLSQSGCGTVNMYPTNEVERMFASGVALVWNLLSLLTIALSTIWGIQLRDVFLAQEKQEAGIRAYLTEKNMSATVRHDVLRFYRLNWRRWMRKTPASDIQFFGNLPVFLRVELYRQVYMPILSNHPCLGKLSRLLIDPICLLAVSERCYLSEKKVFARGEEGRAMFFVRTGELSYYNDMSSLTPLTLSAGGWIGEVALWVRWKYHGWLVAKSSCDLVEVDAAKFVAVMVEAARNGIDLSAIRRYAKLTAEYFTAGEQQSDAWDDLEVIANTADLVGVGDS